MDAPTIECGGRLFYLMGASGAGKDSILAACRQRLGPEDRCQVAHRYITRRPLAEGENHVWLSDTEFSQRLALGSFALNWAANGLRYGIGLEIDLWLRQGCAVIVNGSRAHLPQARSLYGPLLVPVCVVVSPERLRDRLLARGREDTVAIEQRLRRAREQEQAAMHASDTHVIRNDGPLEDAVDALLALIAGERPPTIAWN